MDLRKILRFPLSFGPYPQVTRFARPLTPSPSPARGEGLGVRGQSRLRKS